MTNIQSALQSSVDVVTKNYGVRSINDWRKFADGIEAELIKRGTTFQAVPW